LLKLSRIFWGGYVADNAKLAAKGYKVMRLPIRINTVANTNQGYGQIKGTTKKLGQSYFPVPVCVFKRSTRQLLWETKSRPDGTYQFRNIAIGLECFVVAFDPNNQYNAVIQDKVVAK